MPIRAALLLLVHLAAGALGAVEPPPLFAMDTALGGQPAEVAATLKRLGYAGYGATGYRVADLRRALEAQGLPLVNVYLTIDILEGVPLVDARLRGLLADLDGSGAALWLAIQRVRAGGMDVPRSHAAGDAVAIAGLRGLADAAAPHGVSVALYPHTGMWLERCADAVRVATALGRPEVGATFNLCHFLKVEGAVDPGPLLAQALPVLRFVTVNGADTGDTRAMGWDRLIQTIDRGSHDLTPLLATLHRLGYQGPIGVQGYAIGGDQADNLERSMAAWRAIAARVEPTPRP